MIFTRHAFLVLTLSLFISGCISNIFKEPKPTFSDEILIPKLSDSFTSLSGHVYPAWKNQQTNNVITIISDCSSNYSLKTIHNLMNESLDKSKATENKQILVNNRRSYFKKTSGEVDTKPIEIVSYSFEDKGCFYVAALVGNPDKINKDIEQFSKFIHMIDFKK